VPPDQSVSEFYFELPKLRTWVHPIARSINPVDAFEFTGFPPRKIPIKRRALDAVGREISLAGGFGRGILGALCVEISTRRFLQISQSVAGGSVIF